MIILFCLLVFFNVLVFAYFYSNFLRIEKNIDELYDLYYKKEYNFNVLDERKEGLNVSKYVERFIRVLADD